MGKQRRMWGVGVRDLVFVAALGVAMKTSAQNQVVNPNFNLDIPPWAVFLSTAPDPAGSGSAAWTTSEDVSGAIGSSGAAQVMLDANPSTPQAAAGIRQCFAFAPATTINQANYGARFKIPAASVADATVNAAVEIRFFSDAACADFIAGAGGLQGRTISVGVPDDAFWYGTGDPNFIPPLGTVAQSAEVRATVRKLGRSVNAYTVYFDDIFLSVNGTVPVVLQSFSVE